MMDLGAMSAAAHGWAILSLVGSGLCWGSLVALHVTARAVSPVRDAVSRYGISRQRSLYRVQTVAMAVACAALAAALGAHFGAGAPRGAMALLVVAALARAAISWAPMDQPGSPATSSGRRHVGLAVVAFAALASAAPRVASCLREHGAASVPTSLGGWVMLAGVVGMFAGALSPRLRAGFGLMERLFYAGALLFLVAAAGAVLAQP